MKTATVSPGGKGEAKGAERHCNQSLSMSICTGSLTVRF